MLIVTRGYGPLQMIVTRGYGIRGKLLREVLRLFSVITQTIRVWSNAS